MGPLADPHEWPRYQRAYALPSGDLPALWPVSTADLTGVGLEVAHKVQADQPYGDLHYETTRCPDDDQAELLARRVTEHGLLLPFVPRDEA